MDSDIGCYNNCAASCTQAVEKILKHLFITFDLPFETRLSESHNLNALLRELVKTFPELKSLTKQCRFLNDFYIEIRYPGDSFEWINYDTAMQCYQYAKEVNEGIDAIIQNPLYEQKLLEAFKYGYKNYKIEKCGGFCSKPNTKGIGELT
ncbi:MAG TPA: HEPN domain-containing protein [Clostridiales bacterium]|nr:HEPN domain-containing protein [Clostridiales bacterium]